MNAKNSLPIPQFLADLKAAGVHVRVAGDQLKVRAPAGVLTDEHKRALTARKSELLAWHRERSQTDLPLADRSQPLAASPAQKRLWFFEQLMPGTPLYHTQVPAQMEGELDVAALERAFAELVAQHEAFRTRFVEDAGALYTELAPHAFRLPLIELAPEHADAWTHEEARRSFDLVDGPLYRATLLKLGPTSHRLVVTIHHIVTDAWSIGLFFRELAGRYAAIVEGRAQPAAPVRQPADYAAWQNAQLAQGGFAREIAHWKARLAGLPALELPTDRPRPRRPNYEGDIVPVALSASASQKVRELATKLGATPYAVLAAAYAALHGRVANKTDVALGTAVADRPFPELTQALGLFVNSLVLRAELGDDPSFESLVARMRDEVVTALDHATVPFDEVVRAVGAPAADGRNPLFQASFVLETATFAIPPMPKVEWRPLLHTPDAAIEGIAKFDLSLVLGDEHGSFRGTFEYATALFDRATVERFAERFATLVEDAVADPARPVSQLRALTERELADLDRWNATGASVVRDTLVDRFDRAVDAHGDRPALTCEGETLSYRELERRANRLANHLRALGVAPGEKVGVYVPRSLDMVVALVGIAKSGGAYLPIDPDNPPQRTTLIAEDAELRFLVTQAVLTVPSAVTAQRVDLEDTLQASDRRPESVSSPHDLAYVIYTSGSTGAPKGTLIEHRNATALLDAMQPIIAPQPDDVWTMFHSYAFDFSVWEMWGPLASGGRVVIVTLDRARRSEALHALIRDEGVTVLNQTPESFYRLTEVAVASRDPLALRAVLVGGETLKLPRLRPWFAHFGDEKPIVNQVYGPTETTVFASCTRMRTETLERDLTVIGPPIPGYTMRLLDARGRQVPVGSIGEICIGGGGVCRGYFKRPEMTDAKFVADPFVPGGRMYKSGDHGRYRDDGRVEFVGRMDDQVKIRGFRIELAEVEAGLNAHPAIAACTVVVREDGGNKRLIAYVVAVDGPLDATALRAELKANLPHYMVPSVFVELEALPLTVTGKVDRAALPAPESTRQADFVAPRDELERAVTEVIAQVMEVDAVGMNDDFYALGGHSLLAVKLASALRERFGRPLTVADLLQNPSVEAIAGVLRAPAIPPARCLVPIGARKSDDAIFMIHPGGGVILPYLALAAEWTSPKSMVGVQAVGVEEGTPHARVGVMVEHYARAIEEAQPSGPLHLAGWCLGGVVAFEVARKLASHGRTVASVTLIDTFPTRPDELDDPDVFARFGDSVGAPIDRAAFAGHPLEAQLRILSERLFARGVVPSVDIGAHYLARIHQVYRAHVEAAREHTIGRYAGRVTLLRARELSPHVPSAVALPDYGWRAHAPNLEVIEVPGDHDTMMSSPHVRELARAIDRATMLERADSAAE